MMCAYAGVCQKGAWGVMQCGKGFCAGKHHVGASTTLSCVTHPSVERASQPVQGVALVSQWQMDIWTHKHHLVHAACALPMLGACAQPGEWQGCSSQPQAEMVVPGARRRMSCGCPVLASKHEQSTRHLLCAQMQILNLGTIWSSLILSFSTSRVIL